MMRRLAGLSILLSAALLLLVMSTAFVKPIDPKARCRHIGVGN